MNRNPQFRAFDKATNKMIATGFSVVGETTMFGAIDQYLDANRLGRSFLQRLGDVEIMQFTGLKDKTGKEIYEGDVISCVGGYEDNLCESNHEVIWDKETLQFAAKCINHSDIVPLHEFDTDYVVGNIYETPELLK